MNRLNANHLKLGRPLLWDVFDAQNNLLLSKGYVVQNQHQLEGLLERGLFVSEEDFAAVAAAPPVQEESPVFNPFWLWDDLFSKVVYFLKYANNEEMLEDKLTGTSFLVTTLTDNDPDAALASILLKDATRYAYAHSLHVAVLASVISGRLGWPEAARRDAVRAALSMNVAMIELQMALLQQKEPLTEDQRREVDTHCERGYLFLRKKGISSQNWLEAVRQHHQHLILVPGEVKTPSGLVISQLLRVLDVFCAKISPRAYRRAIQPPVAAREIYVAEREGCAELVDALIKEIGLYMPGTFVKLDNGETALVVKRGETVSTPKVISLSRGDGMPYMDGMKRDTARSEFAVKTVVPRDKIMHMLNLSKIWGY
ncbi:MAG: hypothetical protein H6R18_2753 [Proteobacteria bacterium]|nr:hypothetical protein [Pseudomonadota bacterium]